MTVERHDFPHEILVSEYDIVENKGKVVELLRDFISNEEGLKKESSVRDNIQELEELEGEILNHCLGCLNQINKLQDNQRGKFFQASEDNKTVGIGLAIIETGKPDPNQAYLYFGRSHVSGHKGVAHKILSAEIEYLRSQGIKKYFAYLTPKSLKVYESSGLKISSISPLDNMGSSITRLVEI